MPKSYDFPPKKKHKNKKKVQHKSKWGTFKNKQKKDDPKKSWLTLNIDWYSLRT